MVVSKSSVASLVMGIVSMAVMPFTLLYGVILQPSQGLVGRNRDTYPWFGFLAINSPTWILALLAVVFGVCVLSKGWGGKGLAIAGVICGGIPLILVAIVQVVVLGW
ncbi:MAG: hypothetical protein LBR77_08050 [Lachnospiraceae bacterium]|jgi:hypothetical protein|nr:hypothetical protein [Lachnospiraceae bacterium]